MGRSGHLAPVPHVPGRWHLQLAHTVLQVFWPFQGGNLEVMKNYSDQIIAIDCSLDILTR